MTTQNKLNEVLNKLKIAKELANLPKHEAWVPFTESEKAKGMGIRWNSELKRKEFAAQDPVNHPAARYLPDNFIKLVAAIPFDVREDFKQLGVVTIKDADGKWSNYVMKDEMYVELIQGLSDLELL